MVQNTQDTVENNQHRNRKVPREIKEVQKEMQSETDPELIQMLELVVKDFKSGIYKYAYEHKEKYIRGVKMAEK